MGLYNEINFFVSALKTFPLEIFEKIFFSLNQLIFLLPTGLEGKSQLSKIFRKKMENNYVIKLVPKRKREIRKDHTSFFGFNF